MLQLESKNGSQISNVLPSPSWDKRIVDSIKIRIPYNNHNVNEKANSNNISAYNCEIIKSIQLKSGTIQSK